jgi:HEAT repeat protein
METILVALGLAVFGVYAWLSLQRTVQMGVWRAAAEKCGLTDLDESNVLRGRYRIEDGPVLEVRFETYTCRDPDNNENTLSGTRFSIDGRGQLLPLSLTREGRGLFGRERPFREIQIGDDRFDDDFIVNGPATFVRAVLDADTRRLLCGLLAGVDLEVKRGVLKATVPPASADGTDARQLARMLSLLLDAARRLQRPRDVVARLAQNARHDPDARVRLANLLTLVGDYHDHPATEPALLAASADDSDMVRLRAAIALGERGATLLQIARFTQDDEVGARAVATLDRHLSLDDVNDLLSRALRLRFLSMARACLTALGNRGGEAVALLGRVMGVEEGDLAVAAADALAATGSPIAERLLVAALVRDLPALRVAAAGALGRVGSVSAVLPLKEAEARHADDGIFRRAARQAVAEIQSRLGAASPGQVSLATAEAGTLSLVDDERGRLSLKDRSG